MIRHYPYEPMMIVFALVSVWLQDDPVLVSLILVLPHSHLFLEIKRQ